MLSVNRYKITKSINWVSSIGIIGYTLLTTGQRGGVSRCNIRHGYDRCDGGSGATCSVHCALEFGLHDRPTKFTKSPRKSTRLTPP